ncbi:disulfide bond formation protein DsbC [Acidobacteria bacterium AB60]|nr:disulfide bond formation protein DsbC [Acidobacteria bacterium AB60]
MKPVIASVLLALTGSLATAQFSSEKPDQSTSKLGAVDYLYPEQVTLAAGKPSPVALHFRIEPGFHINSHAPKDEFLIPTALSIPEDSGVRLDAATYPPGADFFLPADPDTKLSVYTGEFTIQAKLIAEPGDHLVKAKLRYQACDKTACMPPRTITVPIDITGK